MSKIHHLPEFNRISTLSAMILLAYNMARFVDLPNRFLELKFPGIYLTIELNANTVVAILVAGLTASGADWLIRAHPTYHDKTTIQYWVLPGLTAWVLGIILNIIDAGFLWWVAFTIGAAMLLLVLIAEYIVVDANNIQYPIAVAGLTALSFALYFILSITLRIVETRFLLLLPTLTISIGLISLRFIYLRLYFANIFSHQNAQIALFAGCTIAIIMAQLITALHYWPSSPIGFGLALIGPAYALTSLFGNMTDGRQFSQALLEPILILVMVWGMALWIR